MTIVVVDYDPRWSELFEALRARVASALGELALAIEHVGSTSVPGLAAKPIIDMDVVVRGGDVAEGIARLAQLGYRHRGDLGILEREAFEPPAGSPAHHLYLCPEDSQALANHRAVRDFLRGDPVAARAYGELKKQLAAAHGRDIDGYIAGKTAFLVGVLREVGFSPDALSAITRMNAVRKP